MRTLRFASSLVADWCCIGSSRSTIVKRRATRPGRSCRYAEQAYPTSLWQKSSQAKGLLHKECKPFICRVEQAFSPAFGPRCEFCHRLLRTQLPWNWRNHPPEALGTERSGKTESFHMFIDLSRREGAAPSRPWVALGGRRIEKSLLY